MHCPQLSSPLGTGKYYMWIIYRYICIGLFIQYPVFPGTFVLKTFSMYGHRGQTLIVFYYYFNFYIAQYSGRILFLLYLYHHVVLQ